VQELPHQRESAAIASAIVQLARGLGLGVVAEGVETEAQRSFLVEQGCDQLQGLIISAPLTPSRLLAWLNTHLPSP
jgi:EAL domain-containing protein (putative c-di-GMP-specific phosphodiesterase class I)